MKLKLAHTIALTLLILGNVSSQAQDLISTHFSVMMVAPFDTLGPGMRVPDVPELWYLDNGKPTKVSANWNIPTSPSSYRGPTQLQFYTSASGNGNIESLRRHSGVTIPRGISHSLLMFFQNANGSYAILPLDVGTEDMPYGSLKLINFTGENVAAVVGSQRNALSNRASWVVPVTEATDQQVDVQLARQDDERWRLFYRTGYAVSESSRFVLLLHRKNITSGPYRVRKISGFGEAPDADTEFDIEAMENANIGEE